MNHRAKMRWYIYLTVARVLLGNAARYIYLRARRLFFLPDTILQNYRVRRFWRIAARQHQVARRLEWRLKNKP